MAQEGDQLENWRNSVIASEESLQLLDLTERSQQESIDVVFRNVFLQISFFVSFSNGVAVLFSRAANLPCGLFSMMVPITIAFIVGVTAPIAFGYYRLLSFCHQFAKTVEQRNRMKTTATDLLRTRDALADDSQNFRDLMEDLAETVEKLEEVKDSPQHLQFQHTMYRRILELIAVGVVFYSILFLIVAYSMFCGGNKSLIEVEMGGCNASITALTIELFKYNLSVVSERLGCTISFPGCGNTEIEEKVKIIFLPTEKPMMLEVCTPLNSTLPLQVEMGGYEAPVAAFEKPLLLEEYAPLIATLPLEVQAKMDDLINCISSELNLNSSHFWNSPESS